MLAPPSAQSMSCSAALSGAAVDFGVEGLLGVCRGTCCDGELCWADDVAGVRFAFAAEAAWDCAPEPPKKDLMLLLLAGKAAARLLAVAEFVIVPRLRFAPTAAALLTLDPAGCCGAEPDSEARAPAHACSAL